MVSIMLNLPAEIKERLISTFEDWLKENIHLIKNERIRERWRKNIEREIRKFRKMKPTIPAVAGFAMWVFCLVNNLGVVSTVGIDGYAISDVTWERGFDRKTTEKLIMWVSEALKLMQIPKGVAEELGWC